MILQLTQIKNTDFLERLTYYVKHNRLNSTEYGIVVSGVKAHQIVVSFQSAIPLLSPVRSPAIANDPVIGAILTAPTHHSHNVVGYPWVWHHVSHNATTIVTERWTGGVNLHRSWTILLEHSHNSFVGFVEIQSAIVGDEVLLGIRLGQLAGVTRLVRLQKMFR